MLGGSTLTGEVGVGAILGSAVSECRKRRVWLRTAVASFFACRFLSLFTAI
jgi:hypothetical protein